MVAFANVLQHGNTVINTYIDSKDGIIKSKEFQFQQLESTETSKVGVLGLNSDNKIVPVELNSSDVLDFKTEVNAQLEESTVSSFGFLKKDNSSLIDFIFVQFVS